MADRMTDKPTHTQLAAERGPTGHTEHDVASARSVSAGVVSLVTGGLGVVAGIIPLLGAGAVLLALVALAFGLPSLRHGPSAAGFRYARLGVVLAVVAIIVGVINLGIQLDWFDYFTTPASLGPLG